MVASYAKYKIINNIDNFIVRHEGDRNNLGSLYWLA